MKKLVFFYLFTFSLAPLVFAQSGRKAAPTPTPAAAAEDQTPAYSESISNKPRRIYAPPTFRVGSDGRPTTGGKKQGRDETAPAVAETVGDGDVVQVATNLVTIPVSVFDRNGLYVPNLKQENFKILENGKEQEVAYFGSSEKPFTVVLLLDTSLSTEYKIEEIQRAAKAFVDQLKPQDSVMVIEFDANLHVLTPATQDRPRIYKAIEKADFGYGTSLYSAIDSSLRKYLNKIAGRKAMVLFTDGVDTTSRKSTYEGSVNLAEESDALIFPIYYNTFSENRGIGYGTSPEEYALGRQYIGELAGVTGGRVFRPESTPGGLIAAFEGIAEELRRQYNIGYYPQDDARPGQRKLIKVRVDRPNLIVRARDSYVVGAGVGAAPQPSPGGSKPQ